jgi:parallel beta-helix repeat protein
MRQTVIVLATFAALCAPAAARVISVPDSAGTIQAGIDMASSGDTVLVAPGTYIENISWSGMPITLASHYLTSGDTMYIDSTVIDANHAGTGLTCNSGVDTSALICGFTIRNGNAANGGGIYCAGASPTITHNIIEDNTASSDGAGIMIMSGAAPVVEHNIVRHNQTNSWGGGIYICDGSSPRVRWNVLYDNGVALGGAASRRDRARIIGGRMVEPGEDAGPFVVNGGAILITNYQGLVTKPVIHNNTIVDNLASGAGGGIYSNRALPDIRNNIVVSNEGYGIYSAESTLVCDYNDVWSNKYDYGGAASAGTGAISAPPLFADSLAHDYHLTSGSPCIDSGDPSLPWDPDSTRSDIGAFYSPQTGIAGNPPVPVQRSLSVRPNPFVGSTVAVLAARIVVCDAMGNVVEKSNAGRFGSGLAAGVYFVQAEGFSRTRVVKLARH